jgi:uncharacterized protein (TIGR00730 family)
MALKRAREKVIAVFGGSRVEAGTPAWDEAYCAGKALAEAGFVVMNGGYNGAMSAVSQGARQAGGHVIGVTCDLFSHLSPNPWLTEERRTTTLHERLRVMTQEADGYLALRGSVGTLSELTLAWSLIYTGSVPPRPLVLLGEPYRRLLQALAETTYLRPEERSLVRVVETVAEAVEALRSPTYRPSPNPRG